MSHFCRRAGLMSMIVSCWLHAVADVRVEFVGQWGGAPNAVATRDHLAFVGVGSRVVVLDLTDPAVPVQIGQSELLPSMVGRIVLAGDRAYIDAWEGGIEILDVSTPTDVRWLGRAPIRYGTRTDNTRDIAVSGDIVFAAAHDSGLRIFDMSVPNNPVELGRYDPDDPAVSVVAHNGYVFLGTWYHLRVLDVSDPGAPRVIATLNCQPMRFSAVGDFLYVAEDFLGLSIIDISNPANPMRLSNLVLSETYPLDAVFNGAHVFVCGGRSVFVCDAADPAAPRLVGTYELSSNAQERAHGIAFVESVAYITGWPERIHAVNFQQPQTPSRLGMYDNVAHLTKCTFDVGRVFASGYTLGVQMLDVTDPTSPSRLARFGDSRVINVEVADNLAMLAEGTPGVAIYDVSDSRFPLFVSRFDTPDVAIQARRDGDYLYVADRNSGVVIADVSSVADPRFVSVIATQSAQDLLKVNNVLYVADLWEGLVVVDVSDPEQPRRLGSHSILGQGKCLTTVGNYLYVGGGVNVFDISTLAQPVLVSSMPTNCAVTRMEHVAERIYLAACRLRMLDVSEPAVPRWMGDHQPDGGGVQDLATNGDVVFLATGEGGLEVIRAHEEFVDLAQLARLLSAFGSCWGDSRFNAYLDLNGNGCIDLADLQLLLAHFG